MEGVDPVFTHRALRALARPQKAELWGMTGKEVQVGDTPGYVQT